MIYVHESSFAKHIPYFPVEVKPETHERLFHVVVPRLSRKDFKSAIMEAEAFNSQPSFSKFIIYGEGRILFSKGNSGNKLGVLHDRKVFSREEQPRSGWSSPYSTLRTT